MKDPFKILSLPSDAPPEEVKARWRVLAKAGHPDHGGDPVEFKKVLMAYREALRIATHAPCKHCNGVGRMRLPGAYFTGGTLTCRFCKGRGRRW